MEPVGIDHPRGAPEIVARLAVPVADLVRRFGLEFAPVDNDLGPAVLALARLSTGTLIGFARLTAYEPGGDGTDVVAFGGWEPRDVVVELLFDTGLTFEQVTWLLPPHGQTDARRWARSRNEADLYFGGRPDVVVSSVGTEQVLRSGGEELWLRPGAQLKDDVYSAAGDSASTIIDAGRWVVLAHESGQAAARLLERHPGGPLDEAVRAEIDGHLVRAASAYDEALKFVPSDADAVPLTACWSTPGLQAYREDPAQFGVEALLFQAQEYHLAVAEFRLRFGTR